MTSSGKDGAISKKNHALTLIALFSQRFCPISHDRARRPNALHIRLARRGASQNRSTHAGSVEEPLSSTEQTTVNYQ